MDHASPGKIHQADIQGGTPGPKIKSPTREPVHLFHQIQQAIGNRALGRRIQAKLEISQPNDVHEHEADRVADEVMRMPDPAVSRLSNSSSSFYPPSIARAQAMDLQRACTDCEEEEEHKIQRKEGSRGTATPVESGHAPSVVDNVLNSPGRPLDSGTRAFFEPRFGYDFSNVRLHTDATAASSAREVNALAYTVGTNIVLGRQHAHDSSEGQRILAHELTHVIQQNGSPTKAYRYNIDEEEEHPYEATIARKPAPHLQRTATWAAGVERRSWDAADRTMSKQGFGWTWPTLNGSIIPSSTAAGTAIKAPTFSTRSVAGSGTAPATSEASFTANATNTASYDLDAIDGGPHSVASTKDAVATRSAQLGMAPPTQCTGPAASTFSIKGQPDDTAHSAAILAHERHHGSDHKTEFGNVIGGWNTAVDAAIAASTKYGGPDAATAEANMWTAVGGAPATIATNQHNAWMAASGTFHASPAGRTRRPTNIQADATCATSSMDHTP